MNLNRREFLAAAVGATVATVAGCQSSPSIPPTTPAPPQPIIDTHQHVWDLKQFRLPWLDNAGDRLNRSYTVADYMKAAAGLNVTRAVYAEVAVAPDQRQAEADYVVALCRSQSAPTAAAVIGGSVRADAFPAYISQFKSSPYVKGVRDPLARGAADDKQFMAGIRLLGDLGMSFDLLMGSELLGEAARVVAASPGTRFVLDHCGNPSVKWFAPGAERQEESRRRRKEWEQGVARLADLPNVVCKISGVAESGEEGKVTADVVAPPVNFCLDRFGDDRVIFASNWPVCLKTISFAGWVAVLKEVTAPRGETFNRKLFHDNAAAFFRL